MTLELARKRRSQSDLIHELVDALNERASMVHMHHHDKDTGFHHCPMYFCKKARALIEKAKLLDDCIPIDDAAEVAANQGHRYG